MRAVRAEMAEMAERAMRAVRVLPTSTSGATTIPIATEPCPVASSGGSFPYTCNLLGIHKGGSNAGLDGLSRLKGFDTGCVQVLACRKGGLLCSEHYIPAVLKEGGLLFLPLCLCCSQRSLNFLKHL